MDYEKYRFYYHLAKKLHILRSVHVTSLLRNIISLFVIQFSTSWYIPRNVPFSAADIAIISTLKDPYVKLLGTTIQNNSCRSGINEKLCKSDKAIAKKVLRST